MGYRVRKTHPLKLFLLRGLEKMKNLLDNNANCVMEKNGESSFIAAFSRWYSKPITVFDVGSNLGAYIDHVRQHASLRQATIHSFEPTRYCQKTLKKKHGEESSVILNAFGLSDVNEDRQIYFNEEGSGLTSLYQRDLSQFGTKLNQEETVQVRRADQYIEEKGIERIHVIKIDVEGHEKAVLEGFGEYLRPTFIDCIQFEYNNTNIDAGTTLFEFYRLLEEKGFVLTKMMPRGLEIRPYYYFMENFTYANYVALSPAMVTRIQSTV